MTTARTERISKIHLDPVGGIAGDMFAACLLDAFPHLWDNCLAALAALDLGPDVAITRSKDKRHAVAGTVFSVSGHEVSDHPHTHVHWWQIREQLHASILSDKTKTIACSIFSLLAEAEATVHASTVERVAFHEVGALDSIVDIVIAATLIEALGDCIWSVGSLPLCRGLTNSQHGKLPLPAPATTLLLKGYILMQDEELGERITPTGAAILKYLNPTQNHDPIPRRLLETGIGLGTRCLKERANMLRICAFVDEGARGPTELVDVLRCEIDDQTGEDLAVALDHIRAATGVRDVCQWPVIGKKGRMAVAVQIIVSPDHVDAVTNLLLMETCTLGVRRITQGRSSLDRSATEQNGVRLKIAHRPAGPTAKAEMDDLQAIGSHAARQEKRQRAEATALEELSDD